MRMPRLDTFRSRKRGVVSGRSGTARRSSDKGKFQCVSVLSGWPSCAAVHELEGKRFLPEDAPSLPLPGCNQEHCGCAYQHHADRRQGPRRDDDLGLPGAGFGPAENRRKSQGRRKEDARRGGQQEVQDYFEYATGAYKLSQLNEARRPAE